MQKLIMMASSNGKIFRVTGHLFGEFTDNRWIPRTKASVAEIWWFFHLSLNKRLSKQWLGFWFETPSRHYDLSYDKHVAPYGSAGSLH